MKTIDKIIILVCLVGVLAMSWTLYRQYLDEKDFHLTFQSNKIIEGVFFKYLSIQEEKSYLNKLLYKYPVYDNKGNMTNEGTGITYKYNSLHQRVEKSVTVGSATTKT